MKEKEQKIKEAWGVHYAEDIDENGFRTYSQFDVFNLNQWTGDYWKKGFNEITKEYWVRPKSLVGIEKYYSFKKINNFEFYEVNILGVVKSIERNTIQKKW